MAWEQSKQAAVAGSAAPRKVMARIAVLGIVAVASWWGIRSNTPTFLPNHERERALVTAHAAESLTIAGSDDVVESLLEGGTTIVVAHDADTGAEKYRARMVSRPLSDEEIVRLTGHISEMRGLLDRSLPRVEEQPESVEREIRLASRRRSEARHHAVLAEAGNGKAFQIVDGPMPRSDSQWHMFTMPRPDKQRGWWVVPLDKAKYPEIERTQRDLDAVRNSKNLDYARIWNRLHHGRRRQIVDEAAKADADSKVLLGQLEELRSAGVGDTEEVRRAQALLSHLRRIAAECPSPLSDDLEAMPGKTRFNRRPPDS